MPMDDNDMVMYCVLVGVAFFAIALLVVLAL